ncbi:MAG: hypothetical protein F4Y31_05880 [Gammaproteobacteria bacterium]|nr:hypothetical protein [Gammaproteobacteria bacterium]MYE49005.1 hypothetical protein [Gammaproteobacteria bacterium]MYF68387.1 hypothetical protein [Gammaproteobacteria bacterium]MYK38148.1 hypothetical protein [Gammaproteobacteria bacterium]
MRLLLDQECAAVAGGHESECEQAVTLAFIVGGALAGAAVSGGGGALVGAAVGSHVADATAHYICSSDEESDEEPSGPSGNPFRPYTPPNPGSGSNSGWNSGAPLQYVVDSAGNNY